MTPTAFLLAGCLGALAFPPPGQAPDPDAIDAWFGRIVQERDFSGVVLLAHGADVLLNKGYGFADDETGTPMTAETVMLTGSISKQFTATAVLLLEERGLLDVDDPISEYLDGVPADKATITIHQLLTHTAGFSRDHFQHDLTPMELDEALAVIYGMALGSSPGTDYHYSNTGYALLAAIVQTVSSRLFTEFMHEEIFEPAGLSFTGFFGDDWSEHDVAVTYFNGAWQGRPSNFPGPFWGNMGNAGVMSTAADLYRWISVLRAGEILSPENVDRLFGPHVTVRPGVRYGYGWFTTDETELGREIGHGGVGIGGNSEIAFYPYRDLTIIVLSNHAVYRAEDGVAIEASLPAREARNQLRSNIGTGDFSLLPEQTLVRSNRTSWAGGVGIAVLLLGCGLAAFAFVSYRRDVRRAHARVVTGCRVVETGCGPIEYGEIGDGPPVLAVHGAGGGFDQGIEVAQPLAGNGFRVIAMSRFGYLGTSLPADASAAAQADAHACLLDALGIERVAVVGASAGAPSSMQFALRHPERTSALVLLVPAAYPFHVAAQSAGAAPERTSGLAGRLVDAALRSDFFFWAASALARDTMLRAVLGTPPGLVRGASEGERVRIANVLDHVLPVSRRRLGLLNDLAVVTSLPRYDLERIKAPTLVIGVADCLYGTYASAQYCADNIPGARFVSYPSGGHLWVGHENDITAEVRDFLSPRQR